MIAPTSWAVVRSGAEYEERTTVSGVRQVLQKSLCCVVRVCVTRGAAW